MLRYSHEQRSRLHQRDKVSGRTHASELPRCFVEDGAGRSKVEQGESLDTRSTSIQLSEARDELQLLKRGIDSIQKLCELASDDN